MKLMRKEEPLFLIGSPPCTVFSIIQSLNIHKNGQELRDQFEVRKVAAVKHIKCCAQLYRMQMAAGRYFLHEHPHGATSWDLDVIKELESKAGVMRIRADQSGASDSPHNPWDKSCQRRSPQASSRTPGVWLRH